MFENIVCILFGIVMSYYLYLKIFKINSYKVQFYIMIGKGILCQFDIVKKENFILQQLNDI